MSDPTTPYAKIPHLLPNSMQPEVPVDDGFDAFDTMINAPVTLHAPASGPLTVTQEEQYGGSYFIVTPQSPAPGGAFNVNFLAVAKGPFVVENETLQSITVQINGQASPPTALVAGALGQFASNGVRVKRIV